MTTKLEKYWSLMRVLATVSIFTTGFLEATYNPGVLDLLNAASVALVLYAIWRGSVRRSE